jgi:hypothetical protein
MTQKFIFKFISEEKISFLLKDELSLLEGADGKVSWF